MKLNKNRGDINKRETMAMADLAMKLAELQAEYENYKD